MATPPFFFPVYPLPPGFFGGAHVAAGACYRLFAKVFSDLAASSAKVPPYPSLEKMEEL